MRTYFATLQSAEQIERVIDFAFEHHAEEEIYLIFNEIISPLPLDPRHGLIERMLSRLPELSFVMLKSYPPDNETSTLNVQIENFASTILRCIIRCANKYGIASLAALEKLAGMIAKISLEEYCELLLYPSAPRNSFRRFCSS